MVRATFLSLTLLAGLALASPVAVRNNNATAIILAAAPKSASCAGVTDSPEECGTAAQAAQFLPAAFQKYGIYSPGEMAAILSLMAFETGDFRYNRNHFPGRPGQGTRNMQMAKYNLLYALSVPELEPKAKEIAGDVADGNDLPDDKKNQILDLVMPDEYTWGSAAWFVTTQCEQSVRDELAEGTVKGFTMYTTECIGTSSTEDRVEKWSQAKAAFGLP
ncbi:hypothetical protein CkaCkLH20_02751 [Colletotrichum karsti]|uniref:Uncharacterized protein n=1 Tax=Colletotrichum karsti TaxID=1095194 RepID=A0A9P6IIF4_9PEZI|nr:uncharacterized protein CkaCkLH20_02751 [Colletotrichum karsti]KAF9879940.1 hypothetical protein CkaCkLH20_02751 [Colletotrichum karsti]